MCKPQLNLTSLPHVCADCVHAFEPEVQISDVVVGLLGKCFSYLNRTTQPEVIAAKASLAAAQEAGREMLARLLDPSMAN